MNAIRTPSGQILGYLRIISPYQHQIFDKKGALLGFFNPKIDRTFDRSGKLVAQGDARAMLLKHC
jgi:hypothetical protein